MPSHPLAKAIASMILFPVTLIDGLPLPQVSFGGLTNDRASFDSLVVTSAVYLGRSLPLCGHPLNSGLTHVLIHDRCRHLRSRRLKIPRKSTAVSYAHLRAHETRHDLVCRL